MGGALELVSWLTLHGMGNVKCRWCEFEHVKLMVSFLGSKVWGRNKLSSLKGRNTYNVRCINVDSMQEVTDSLYQTINRCFPQFHFLYWWRGWRSNVPSILIPKKLLSNSSGNLPYTMVVLHINARLKRATTACWCDVFNT